MTGSSDMHPGVRHLERRAGRWVTGTGSVSCVDCCDCFWVLRMQAYFLQQVKRRVFCSLGQGGIDCAHAHPSRLTVQHGGQFRGSILAYDTLRSQADVSLSLSLSCRFPSMTAVPEMLVAPLRPMGTQLYILLLNSWPWLRELCWQHARPGTQQQQL
jgi:hypothetical protein